MKTIGLLGGMSWESTLQYYRALNEGVKKQLGGLHSAQIILHSVDFAPIEELQHKGNWQGAGRILAQAARGVQAAGADFLLICTNTMHKVAGEIERAIDIPLLHIVEATADVLVEEKMKTVGLLGTAFTMEEDFYRGRLQKRGLRVVVPEAAERKVVHDIIFQELCQGTLKLSSGQAYLAIIEQLTAAGAEAVILGCTEIGLLIHQKDTPVKLFDTTAIHVEKAVTYALKEYLEFFSLPFI